MVRGTVIVVVLVVGVRIVLVAKFAVVWPTFAIEHSYH